MSRLTLRVPNTEEWPHFYDPKTGKGVVFCPMNEPPELGTEVYLEINFVSGPKFFVQGSVVWRRLRLKDLRTRAGVGIQVHPSEDVKLRYVNGWATGIVEEKRKQRRLPVKLRVNYQSRSGRRFNFTRDISTDGVFIRSEALLEQGTPIKLLLMPHEGKKAFDLGGKVVRAVDEKDEKGMAIALKFPSAAEKERYELYVDEIEGLYLAGKLPDEVVG
jgi:Tfp pilus assembly protein PilZ